MQFAALQSPLPSYFMKIKIIFQVSPQNTIEKQSVACSGDAVEIALRNPDVFVS